MTKPINCHFVPQHFLRAWAIDNNSKKTNRIRRIRETGKLEFMKCVSIRSCASTDDLYFISDGLESAEFETIVMTNQLDTPGAEVIEKLRAHGMLSLRDSGGDDVYMLAKYVTALEARNPKVIEKMRWTDEDIDAMREHNLAHISLASADEAAEFLRKIDTGKYAAGLFVPLEHEFSGALMAVPPLELKFTQPILVTSDYPVGRVGDYRGRFMLSLAVTPSHSILWSTDPVLRVLLSQLTETAKAKLVNFFTLGDADAAFTVADALDPFVAEHLGWKNGLDVEAQKKRVAEVVRQIYAE